MRTTREGKWNAWILLTVLLGACGGGAPPEKTLEISDQFQLFVDDYVVQEMRQVTRRLNPLKKHPANPILKPDRSWEGQHTTPTFVAFDRKDRLYKMWYVYIHREPEAGGEVPARRPVPRRPGLCLLARRNRLGKTGLGLIRNCPVTDARTTPSPISPPSTICRIQIPRGATRRSSASGTAPGAWAWPSLPTVSTGLRTRGIPSSTRGSARER